MSMYADYIKEREDACLVDYDYGFCVYKVNKDHIYLQDVFVKKENRNSGICKKIVEDVEGIAKENDKDIIITSFSLNANNWNASRRVIKKCGFKYFTKDKWNKMIYCIKEIK